jgi:hypothetical protein
MKPFKAAAVIAFALISFAAPAAEREMEAYGQLFRPLFF